MRYRIAFNRMALTAKLPSGDRRWAEFNDGFDNLTLSNVEIADQIYKGYAFTTWHDGRRSIENFICGQHIAIDMDTGDARSTLDTLMLHPWVRMYASLLYTTPSHTDHAPRARVVFMLDRCIESATGYTEAAKFVISQFDGADVACSDASRFFYGSLNCDMALPDGVLPVDHLRKFYADWQRKHPHSRRHTVTTPTQPAATTEQPKADSTLFERLLAEMAATREGSRNLTLNRIGFLTGKMIADHTLPSESDAMRRLLDAALRSGLPDQEAERTIARAVRHGQGMH